MSAVSASSSGRPVGTFRYAERCFTGTRQARRSETRNLRLTCFTQARRRAGLRSSPVLLSQDQLLECEIRGRLALALRRRWFSNQWRTTGSILLQILQPLHLIGLQAAFAIWLVPMRHDGSLLAPAVVGEPHHAYRTNRFGHRPTLRHQYNDLSKFGDNLLGLVLPMGHSCILQMARKPYLREDHFSGGRPGQ